MAARKNKASAERGVADPAHRPYSQTAFDELAEEYETHTKSHHQHDALCPVEPAHRRRG